MKNLEEKLKNPVWYSLNETHNPLLIKYEGVQFYQTDICSFGAFKDATKTANALNKHSKIAESFFLVVEKDTPTIDTSKVVLKKKFNGCQMVLDHLVEVEIKEKIILLTKENINEVYDLIWLVMPDFYKKRGFEMGKFFGIYKDNKLVAISGQRMQTDDFIEISSVVTHPDYTRQGFAKQLIYHTTKEILKEKKLPILHTNKGNTAIPLYEKLGFKLTRDMNWWLFCRK
ncbi:GNAT family N-acetyltransferase [Polaribacter sp. Z014]|uniref:GNAT family N-acetyltransferase n=1 Tax=unclassified Polaribacter TaxID=196858 RepID=UPI00193C124F|nr:MULTISPECIES: GNAT family N-acetyltransferase [unclassified Polaribacter]MCL7763320.1 GNAT family N-acetyltransferase [Polaribacter sp. Z014]QVY67264.1 GNAT family N-acetyltransferase [Polaribacter sp. Q13]